MRLAYLAWIAVCLIWGTTYLGIRIALETIPPALVGAIRYVLAGLILATILRLRGERLPPRSSWGGLVLVGEERRRHGLVLEQSVGFNLSLTSLREKLMKIGAKLVAHGRYMTFQMAEVAVPCDRFRRILQMIDGLRPERPARC